MMAYIVLLILSFIQVFYSAEEVQKLRNMIEFFDSTNNPNFKMQEHVLFPETEIEQYPLKHHSKST